MSARPSENATAPAARRLTPITIRTAPSDGLGRHPHSIAALAAIAVLPGVHSAVPTPLRDAGTPRTAAQPFRRAPGARFSDSESNSHLYAVSRIHGVEQRTRPMVRELVRRILITLAGLIGAIAARFAVTPFFGWTFARRATGSMAPIM